MARDGFLRAVLLVLTCLWVAAWADVDNHRYAEGEAVGLWANKVADLKVFTRTATVAAMLRRAFFIPLTVLTLL
jgi:hypothetical protein